MSTSSIPRLLGILGVALVGAASGCISDVVPNQRSLPRCDQVSPSCGSKGQEDCCAAPLVEGGQYNRVNDMMKHATIADFHLDKFEVTVGRFRQFFASYPGDKPAAGAGKHPLIDNSGWHTTWDDSLPRAQAELTAMLTCDAHFHTWTDGAASNEELPVNCVSWYIAFAFCAWDGGRLPTEAEWNYAAAGGDEQRLYPWGDDMLDDAHVTSNCQDPGGGCLLAVGSKPLGKGKWDHTDLAGSLAEWTLDYHGELPSPCPNCAKLKDGGLGREVRGGDFSHSADALKTTARLGVLPTDMLDYQGFRCARDQ